VSGTRSRDRGKRGEREIVRILHEEGYEAFRGWQAAGPTEADIVSNFPFHLEVKYVENLNIYRAIQQAHGDSKGLKPYAVIFRKSNSRWHAAIDLAHFIKLVGQHDSRK
jgi:Holliday junction resolvase